MEAQLKRHEPLYLKHRPQSLDELVGQESVRRTLTNAINFDRISHAYLFTGPRGTGKTSSARILAKSLNCKAGEKATVSPCQQCASCLEIRTGNSPAVFEIDAASNNSVDDARVLIERAPLVAPGGRYKIYIIDECHMLTKEAFNALLKTIEDPPKNVVFILATTEEHKVIPTIVSRCQRLMFRLVQQEDLLLHLRNIADKESIAITDRAIDFIARRSGGGLRDALGLLDQASLLSTAEKPVDVSDLLTLLGALHEDVLLEMSSCILERRGHELLTAANKLLREGKEPAIVVQELARHFLSLSKASYLHDCPDRDQAASKLIVGSPDYLTALYQQAPLFERSELSQLVEILDRLEQTCRRTTQPGMHLEVGLLSLCHRQDMLLMRDMGERITRLEQALAGGGALHTQAPMARPAARPAAAPTAYSAPAPTAHSTPAPTHSAPAPTHSAPAATAQAAVGGQNVTATAQADIRSISITEDTAAPPENDYPAGEPEFTQSQPAPTTPAVSQPAAPAPAAPPAARKSGGSDSEDDDSDSLPAHEVDRIWSELLCEIQRTHIPTHGMILSANAFPLRVSSTELSIGVASDTFQKNLEGRIDRIKSACASVVGKPLHIKVRIVSKEVTAAARPAAAPRERQIAPAPVASGGAPGPDSDEDYEPAQPRHRAPSAVPPIHATDLPPDTPRFPGPDSMPASTAPVESRSDSGNRASYQSKEPAAIASSTHAVGSLAGPAIATIASAPAGSAISAEDLASQSTNANTGAIIKEAYKLFEGPGSRLLGGPTKN